MYTPCTAASRAVADLRSRPRVEAAIIGIAAIVDRAHGNRTLTRKRETATAKKKKNKKNNEITLTRDDRSKIIIFIGVTLFSTSRRPRYDQR